MAKIRRGYSDDFVIKNNKVGIGTSNPQESLDVVGGALQGQDLKVTGVSTQTGFSGFLRADHQIAENTEFSNINVSSLSGEIIVGTGVTVTIDNLPDGDFGPELITNGSFISTTSGWTAYNAVISISNEQLKVDDSADAGSWSSAVQEVNTEPGVKYRLEVGIGTETEGSIYGYYNGRYPSAGTAPYYQSRRYDPVGMVTSVYEFIAGEKITSIMLTANNDGISHYDNVSLKKINVPEESRAGGSQIDTLKVYNTFTPPSGDTNQRPYAPKPGEFYYNYDFKTIEFFDGYGWRQVDNTTRSGRGVFMGGQTLNPTRDLSSMEYINIPSLGNGVNFGEMSEDKQYTAGASSSTRGLIAGGYSPGASPSSVVDTIEYITIASAGGSIDFGNLSDARGELDGCGSSTRGLFMGGEDNPFANMNIIDYVEFATLGDALDFGDITVARRDTTCLSSQTRGFCAGGIADSPVNRVATIDVVTIAAKGNGIDFGDLSQTKNMGNSGCSNSVRGLFGGGQVPYTTNMIDYITMASNGNAIVFGELTTVKNNQAAVSTQIRGVFGSGFDSPSTITNTIDYVTIASTGDAVDFGDMSIARAQNSAVSDSHGGLGGF